MHWSLLALLLPCSCSSWYFSSFFLPDVVLSCASFINHHSLSLLVIYHHYVSSILILELPVLTQCGCFVHNASHLACTEASIDCVLSICFVLLWLVPLLSFAPAFSSHIYQPLFSVCGTYRTLIPSSSSSCFHQLPFGGACIVSHGKGMEKPVRRSAQQSTVPHWCVSDQPI